MKKNIIDLGARGTGPRWIAKMSKQRVFGSECEPAGCAPGAAPGPAPDRAAAAKPGLETRQIQPAADCVTEKLLSKFRTKFSGI